MLSEGNGTSGRLNDLSRESCASVVSQWKSKNGFSLNAPIRSLNCVKRWPDNSRKDIHSG